MYILPKTDKEFEELVDWAKFCGRHDVIMNIKNDLFQWSYEKGAEVKSITFEDFSDYIKFRNEKGWPNWC